MARTKRASAPASAPAEPVEPEDPFATDKKEVANARKLYEQLLSETGGISDRDDPKRQEKGKAFMRWQGLSLELEKAQHAADLSAAGTNA